MYIDKETDRESSLGDYGVRKYDNEIGRFTSIDPLWEKYRSLTPYHYAANNPLTSYDSDGKEVVQVFDENATEKERWEDKKEHRKAIEYLKAKGLYGIYKELDDKEEVIKFKVVRGDPTQEGNNMRYDPATKTIYYNPQSGLMTSNGAQTPAFGIIHEVGHALIHIEAIESGQTKQYWDQIATDVIKMWKDENYVKPEENEVLQRFEIPAAKRAGIPIRTEYSDGFSYETQGSTTTRPTARGQATIRQSTIGGER